MSKLITNDNLKAYHAELAEHIKLLQRNTAYVLDDIVNYDGIILKCTTAGTTNTTKPNISALTVGSTYTDGTCVWTRVDLDKRGIDYYVVSKDYEVDDQVVYNNKIYRCIIAHTSTSTFDATKWKEISPGIASSVYATTTTLWSGAYNTVTAGTPFTLSDDYTNYDELLLMQEGQVLRSLVPSISSGFGYDNDGGQLGTNFSVHIIITFSGTTATPVIWQYGSGIASSTVYIVGRNYIKCEGYYATKDVLFSGNTAIAENAVINLTKPYTDYDYLLFEKAGTGYECITVDVSEIGIRSFLIKTVDNGIEYFRTSALSQTQIKLHDVSGNASVSTLYRITGIKFLPNPNNYSTTEQEIGTWVDGKKLYQVTLTGTIDSSTNSTTRYNELAYNDLSSYNIDTVVDIVGGCYNNNYSFTPFGKFQLAYTSQFYEDNRSVLNVYTDKDTSDNNKLKLYITSGNWYAGLNYVATIKYTKV